MTDPVVEEVRQIRAKIAEAFGFDLTRISDQARQTAESIPGLRYATPDELREQRQSATASPAAPYSSKA